MHSFIVELTKKLTEKSTKEPLIDQLSKKLLRLEFIFISNNSIKARCLKYVVRKILPIL